MEPPVARDGRPRRARGLGSLVQSHWVRGALVVAAVEGLLVVFGVIPRWISVVAAGAVIALYFVRGRRVTSPSARQAVWAVALSQAIVLFFPLVLWIVGAAVIVALAALAALVLVVLVLDR